MMELVPYSARGDRLVSRFHAEELLYEYVQGSLDPVRDAGVKKIIDQDPKLKLEVEAIRRALAYCDTLSGVKFSPERIDVIRNESSAFDQFLKKLKMHEWPGGIRVGMESLFVVSLVFFFAMMVPWNSLIAVLQENQGSVVLSEVTKDAEPEDLKNDFPVVAQKNSNLILPMDQQAKLDPKSPDAFDDEGVPQEEISSLKKPVISLNPVLIPVLIPVVQNPSPLKPVAPPPVVAREPAQSNAAVLTTGWLNKARLTLTNVQAATLKIAEKVTGLGGRKAGQVPLGWAKGQGSYFHFTIPEAKYEELVEALKNYGKLTITKEPHTRVMPDGIVRMIVDIEETASGLRKETAEFIPDPPPMDGPVDKSVDGPAVPSESKPAP